MLVHFAGQGDLGAQLSAHWLDEGKGGLVAVHRRHSRGCGRGADIEHEGLSLGDLRHLLLASLGLLPQQPTEQVELDIKLLENGGKVPTQAKNL